MNQVGLCDDSSHFHIIWFTTAIIIIYGPPLQYKAKLPQR